MTRRLIQISFICWALILFLAPTLVNFASAKNLTWDQEDRVTKTFQVKRGQLFYLKADLGSVEVNSWAQDEVKVTVIKEADTGSKRRAEEIFEDLDLSFDQDSRGVSVRAEYHGPKGWWGERRRLKLHFEVRVPKEFDLDINTAGGSIQVTDLMGKVDLYTSGGSISMGSIDGPVNAKTSGGGIKIEQARGNVYARTSGGSITAGKTSGSLDVETSGGSISLDGVIGDTRAHTSGGGLNLKDLSGNVEASTSGGSIHAEITGKIDRDCTLKTSGGGITVYLPKDIAAEIDAHTSGGRVETDFPITVQGIIKSNALRGKVNNGGPLITLRTSGGSIYIRAL